MATAIPTISMEPGGGSVASATRTSVARWEDWQGVGREHLVLRESDHEVSAESIVIGGDLSAPIAAQYTVVCDGQWRTKSLRLRSAGQESELVLFGDGAGNWRDGSGTPLRNLEGATDVDLAITPFTNTLPIRRLGLKPGYAKEIDVAYVDGQGRLSRKRQRYTCLAPLSRYRFETVGEVFQREIDVDEYGLVLTYPGLFRRLR